MVFHFSNNVAKRVYIGKKFHGTLSLTIEIEKYKE